MVIIDEAGEPIEHIDNSLLLILSYLLETVDMKEIKQNLKKEEPNTIRAFYRLLDEQRKLISTSNPKKHPSSSWVFCLYSLKNIFQTESVRFGYVFAHAEQHLDLGYRARVIFHVQTAHCVV